jgi:hypothetical protein
VGSRLFVSFVVSWLLFCSTSTRGLCAQELPDAKVMLALVEALKPALPYPPADEHDLPSDGNPASVWLVRWPGPGEARVEVVANPLNADNQARANKAEVEIQRAVMAAQQRAQTLYERAVAEFERTGKTDPIDGISLGDEGVAGERFDASNRVVVTATADPRAFRVRVNSAVEPVLSSTPSASLVRVPANVYRERTAAGQLDAQRFHAGEVHLMFGGMEPTVTRTSATSFEIAAAPAVPRPSLLVSIQGNESLVEQIVLKADWPALAAALGR